MIDRPQSPGSAGGDWSRYIDARVLGWTWEMAAEQHHLARAA